MARQVTVTECPSCGAPVVPADYVGEAVPCCKFCNTALPFHDDPPPAPAPQLPVLQVPTFNKAKWWVISAVVPVVVLAVVLPIVLAGARSSSSSSSGNSPVQPGSPLATGFDVMLPGKHPPADFSIIQAVDIFTARCVNGGNTVKFRVPLNPVQFSVPANNNAWYPSGDPKARSTFQGTTVFPEACGRDGSYVVLSDELDWTSSWSTGNLSGVVYDLRTHWSGTSSDGSWDSTSTEPL